MVKETINDRVKEVRKNLNLSQEEFGNMIGLSKSGISNIEKGTRNVTSKHVKLICLTFDVDEYWLTTGVEQQEEKEVNVMKTLFQKRLKELRTENRLSQKQVGLLTGLNEESIRCYEDYGYEPTFYIVCKIAKPFKVSPEYLIGASDDKNYNPVEILKTISTDDLINELRRRVASVNL